MTKSEFEKLSEEKRSNISTNAQRYDAMVDKRQLDEILHETGHKAQTGHSPG